MCDGSGYGESTIARLRGCDQYKLETKAGTKSSKAPSTAVTTQSPWPSSSTRPFLNHSSLMKASASRLSRREVACKVCAREVSFQISEDAAPSVAAARAAIASKPTAVEGDQSG